MSSSWETFAILQKIYGAPSDAEKRRYNPAKFIGSDMKVLSRDAANYAEHAAAIMFGALKRSSGWRTITCRNLRSVGLT
jgi:hypothetical protein